MTGGQTLLHSVIEGPRLVGREDPLEKEMATTPVFLPGESHGQRSLTGHSLRDHKSWTQLND